MAQSGQDGGGFNKGPLTKGGRMERTQRDNSAAPQS